MAHYFEDEIAKRGHLVWHMSPAWMDEEYGAGLRQPVGQHADEPPLRHVAVRQEREQHASAATRTDECPRDEHVVAVDPRPRELALRRRGKRHRRCAAKTDQVVTCKFGGRPRHPAARQVGWRE